MNTKEFEKQTLEQLLIDLKDIDNYKSFRKGAFVYDLGHYQGQLLLQEIERLNNIIEEIRECVKTKIVECYDEGSTIGEFYKICDIDSKIEELLHKGEDKE